MKNVSHTQRFFESAIIYGDFLYLFYIHILNFGIEKSLMSSNNKKPLLQLWMHSSLCALSHNVDGIGIWVKT